MRKLRRFKPYHTQTQELTMDWLFTVPDVELVKPSFFPSTIDRILSCSSSWGLSLVKSLRRAGTPINERDIRQSDEPVHVLKLFPSGIPSVMTRYSFISHLHDRDHETFSREPSIDHHSIATQVRRAICYLSHI